MKVSIDKQGRVVIPKEVRKKYGLVEDSPLELVPRGDVIELIPLLGEDELALHVLREPCKTGDPGAHDKVFSRERVWKR